MRTMTMALVLAAALAGTSPARAAETSTVDRLLVAMRLEPTLDAAVLTMVRTLVVTLPDLGLHQDILADYIEEKMSWEQLRPAIAAIYAETFTEAEMEEMIRFYSSKAGQKALGAAPALSERVERLVKERFESDLAVLEARMKNREFDALMEQATFFKAGEEAPAKE